MSQLLVTAHSTNAEPASLEIVPSSGTQSQAPTEVASSEVKPVGDQSHASSQVMPTGSEAPPNIDDAPSQPDSVKSKKALRKRKIPTTKDSRKSNKNPNKSQKSETSVSNVSGGDVSLTQILGPSLEEMMASDTPVNRSHDSLLGTSPTQSTPKGASSPAAPSDEEHRVPVRRRGTTRLTVVKHQLSEALK